MASPAGLEPATHSLGNCCSILLSYGDIIGSVVGRSMPWIIGFAQGRLDLVGAQRGQRVGDRSPHAACACPGRDIAVVAGELFAAFRAVRHGDADTFIFRVHRSGCYRGRVLGTLSTRTSG